MVDLNDAKDRGESGGFNSLLNQAASVNLASRALSSPAGKKFVETVGKAVGKNPAALKVFAGSALKAAGVLAVPIAAAVAAVGVVGAVFDRLLKNEQARNQRAITDFANRELSKADRAEASRRAEARVQGLVLGGVDVAGFRAGRREEEVAKKEKEEFALIDKKIQALPELQVNVQGEIAREQARLGRKLTREEVRALSVKLSQGQFDVTSEADLLRKAQLKRGVFEGFTDDATDLLVGNNYILQGAIKSGATSLDIQSARDKTLIANEKSAQEAARADALIKGEAARERQVQDWRASNRDASQELEIAEEIRATSIAVRSFLTRNKVARFD